MPLYTTAIWACREGSCEPAAIAVAFPCSLVLVMTLGLLQRAGVTPNVDLSTSGPLLALFYFVGLYLARRRYA